MDRDMFLGCKKHLFANPNILLVDDTEKKIKQFRDYGGHAFKWPCPLSIIDGDIKIEGTFYFKIRPQWKFSPQIDHTDRNGRTPENSDYWGNYGEGMIILSLENK